MALATMPRIRKQRKERLRDHGHRHGGGAPFATDSFTLKLTDEGAAALLAAQPEIDHFNGELRALLGDQGFTRTAAALHRLAHWDPEQTQRARGA